MTDSSDNSSVNVSGERGKLSGEELLAILSAMRSVANGYLMREGRIPGWSNLRLDDIRCGAEQIRTMIKQNEKNEQNQDAEAGGGEWKPTAENINALPKGIKNYVYHLETQCSPPNYIREWILTKDENDALRAKIKALKPKPNTQDGGEKADLAISEEQYMAIVIDLYDRIEELEAEPDICYDCGKEIEGEKVCKVRAFHPECSYKWVADKRPHSKISVGREWIYAHVDKEWGDCDYHNSPPESYDAKGMFIDMLGKIGVEVKGEEE